MDTEGLKSAPGPQARPLLGFMPEMRKNPLGFLTQLSREYPRIAHIKLGPVSAYVINEPAYIKHVLTDNYKNYVKKWGYDKFAPMFGNGLITSNGDFWLRQRKLAQPAFHRQKVEGFAGLISALTQRTLDGWSRYESEGTSFQLGDELRRLAMDIICQTMFGAQTVEQATAVSAAFDILLGELYDRLFSPLGVLGNYLPTRKNIRFNSAVTFLDKVVYGIIAERRRQNADTGDLLSMYLHAVDEVSGERMTDKQLRDEVMTVFIAGHESTANTLSWAYYLLSKFPPAERRLREEVQRVLGDRVPTVADLPNLKYLTCVIEESMRLYPPTWVQVRDAVEDDVIDGYRIPAKSLVIMSQYVVHRNPALWRDPEGFDPDRFLERKSDDRSRYSYFPFSHGPRTCIGNGFAMMEAKIILAMIVQRYHLSLVPGHPVEPDPVMTLRPRHGVKVTVSRQE